MTERRDHNQDPADSSREYDLIRIQGLMKRISLTKDTKAMAVGINAIKAILEGNPHLRQLRGFMGYMDQLHEAQEVLHARELAAFARSQFANPKPPQQQPRGTELPARQQRPSRGRGVSTPLPRDPSACCSKPNSPASFLAAMWSEDEEQVFLPPPSPVSSVASVPLSGRKRRSRRQSPLTQLDSGTPERPAGVSEKNTFPVPSEGGCSISGNLKDFVHAPLEPRTITNKLKANCETENSRKVLVAAKLAFPETFELVQPPLPTTDSSAEPSLPPVSSLSPDCLSPVHLEQKNLRKTVSSELIQQGKLCSGGSGEPMPPPTSLSLQPTLQPEARLAAQPEARLAAQPEARLAAQPEARLAAQPEARLAAQPEARLAAQPEARLAAQPEARLAAQRSPVQSPAAQSVTQSLVPPLP
ncbi:unnamed protein product [Oreochromis niloticus]|nr:unnamed protein product [Mustela putorius furo]